MWISQSDKVTGTCNESDRTCVPKKDQRERLRLMIDAIKD